MGMGGVGAENFRIFFWVGAATVIRDIPTKKRGQLLC
jgi:hypothetical protein